MNKFYLAIVGFFIAMMLTFAPANASTGAVSATEFWTNLWNVTQSSFEDNVCNCTPTQTAYLNSDHTSKVVVYDAGVGYTRNVDSIVIKFDLIDGHWWPRNFASNGGKEQNWHDSSGSHTSYYPVGCTGAPC